MFMKPLITQNRKVGGVGGEGFDLIASKTASASASLDFSWTRTYTRVEFDISNIAPATDDVDFWARTSADGTTFDSGAADYEYNFSGQGGAAPVGNVNTSIAQIVLNQTGATNALGNAAQENYNMVGNIHLPGASTFTQINGHGHYYRAVGSGIMASFFGIRKSAAAVLGVQFLMSSGNIASGTITLRGYR